MGVDGATGGDDSGGGNDGCFETSRTKVEADAAVLVLGAGVTAEAEDTETKGTDEEDVETGGTEAEVLGAEGADGEAVEIGRRLLSTRTRIGKEQKTRNKVVELSYKRRLWRNQE